MLKEKEIRILEKFNRRQLKKAKTSFAQAQRIFNLMYQESLALGAFKKIAPLETIGTDIKLARILNSLK